MSIIVNPLLALSDLKPTDVKPVAHCSFNVILDMNNYFFLDNKLTFSIALDPF